jgi:aspartate aminotransferase
MVVSQRITQVMARLAPVAQFFTASAYARRAGEPGICDFAVGNPHELVLPGFVEALGRAIVPQGNAWFGYKNNEPAACAVVATALRERRGLPFEADDILLTNGAFAALAVVLGAIVDPGDEVIFLSPPWFFYEALIAAAGAQPVRVKIDPTTFNLNLAAIEAAIGPRTRAIIVNSPHNPTGKIYSAATLERLASLLTAASAQISHPNLPALG